MNDLLSERVPPPDPPLVATGIAEEPRKCTTCGREWSPDENKSWCLRQDVWHCPECFAKWIVIMPVLAAITSV